MDVLLALTDHPAVALVAGGICLGAMVVSRLLQRGGANDDVPGLDGMLSAGRYHDAAMLCLRHERFAEAQELFLRAQEPARAAQIASRLGNHRLAGELYERAGELRRAAAAYERAGMAPKARELLATAGVDPEGHPAEAAPAPAARATPNPGASPRRTSAGAVRAPTPAPKPAVSAEARFRALLARGPSDDAAKLELQQAAQQAAEESLAAGDIRKAAEAYRDAGLDDEAIHLYANVLGMPGDAAALVSARGHHERAAELYELAGQRERAAAALAEHVRTNGHVGAYIERIEHLDPRVALRLVEEVTASKPANDDTAEAYYRHARSLEASGERARALETLHTLQRGAGGYRDTVARVTELETQLRVIAAKPTGTLPRAQVETLAAIEAAPAVTTVVVQNFQLTGEMKPGDVEVIAREAARAAGGRALTAEFGAVIAQRALGLESAPVSIELLTDADVRAAREGPSVDELRRFVGDAPCDLSNIEVFYRMGLACLAGGDWDQALRNFDAVEEASPGYRDARRRAENIQSWRSSMGGKITLGGAAQKQGGATAPRYTLRGELGRGGMAVVYRATDTVLDRDVALKFIAESALEKKDLRDMFLREARSVAQLNHPNIVTIYDVGTLDGRTFIAMEYVEGKTVDDKVMEHTRLSVAEALRVTAQVLAALDYAHSRQIVHRDVKPSNMMFAHGGTVKLMDFGLAKSLNATAKASIVSGTPAYMPPEQFTGKNVDHRADLYAVGASLYEMLSGELPFEGYVRTAPPSLRARLPEVPAAIDDALRTAMDPDPAKRFQSAKDFLAPIQRVLAVIDRAVEEREARRSSPDRLPAFTPAPSPSGGFPVARSPSRAKPVTAIMGDAPSPAARTPSQQKVTEAEPPPPLPPSSRRKTLIAQLEEPQLRPPPPPGTVAADPFKSRKGTLLMHAAKAPAQPSARRRPVSSIPPPP